MAADGLALLSARSSAATMMTNFMSCMYSVEGLSIKNICFIQGIPKLCMWRLTKPSTCILYVMLLPSASQQGVDSWRGKWLLVMQGGIPGKKMWLYWLWDDSNWGALPGGHFWVYYPGTLSYNQVSVTQLMTRHQKIKSMGPWSSTEL